MARWLDGRGQQDQRGEELSWTLEVWRGSLDGEVGKWEPHLENAAPLEFATELEGIQWEMEHADDFGRVSTRVVPAQQPSAPK